MADPPADRPPAGTGDEASGPGAADAARGLEPPLTLPSGSADTGLRSINLPRFESSDATTAPKSGQGWQPSGWTWAGVASVHLALTVILATIPPVIVEPSQAIPVSIVTLDRGDDRTASSGTDRTGEPLTPEPVTGTETPRDPVRTDSAPGPDATLPPRPDPLDPIEPPPPPPPPPAPSPAQQARPEITPPPATTAVVPVELTPEEVQAQREIEAALTLRAAELARQREAEAQRIAAEQARALEEANTRNRQREQMRVERLQRRPDAATQLSPGRTTATLLGPLADLPPRPEPDPQEEQEPGPEAGPEAGPASAPASTASPAAGPDRRDDSTPRSGPSQPQPAQPARQRQVGTLPERQLPERRGPDREVPNRRIVEQPAPERPQSPTGELPPPPASAAAVSPSAPAAAMAGGGVTSLRAGRDGSGQGGGGTGVGGTGAGGSGDGGSGAGPGGGTGSGGGASGPGGGTPPIRTGGPLPRRPGGPAIRTPMTGDPRTGLMGRMDISAECRELSRERDPDCRGSRLYEPGRTGGAIPAPAPPPSNIPRPTNPMPRCPPGTPQSQFELSCLPPLDEPAAPKL